jgi:hypothetical protein
MNKFSKTFKNVENDLEGLIESVKAPANSVLEFIKNHKKLIFTLVVGYLVYRYLFYDEE